MTQTPKDIAQMQKARSYMEQVRKAVSLQSHDNNKGYSPLSDSTLAAISQVALADQGFLIPGHKGELLKYFEELAVRVNQPVNDKLRPYVLKVLVEEVQRNHYAIHTATQKPLNPTRFGYDIPSPADNKSMQRLFKCTAHHGSIAMSLRGEFSHLPSASIFDAMARKPEDPAAMLAIMEVERTAAIAKRRLRGSYSSPKDKDDIMNYSSPVAEPAEGSDAPTERFFPSYTAPVTPAADTVKTTPAEPDPAPQDAPLAQVSGPWAALFNPVSVPPPIKGTKKTPNGGSGNNR